MVPGGTVPGTGDKITQVRGKWGRIVPLSSACPRENEKQLFRVPLVDLAFLTSQQSRSTVRSSFCHYYRGH
jgi:hypothetical protein